MFLCMNPWLFRNIYMTYTQLRESRLVENSNHIPNIQVYKKSRISFKLVLMFLATSCLYKTF